YKERACWKIRKARTGVRASRRMRTWPSCFETAAAPPPQHEGLLGMGEERAQNGASIAKRVHDRASGTSCKARVVAFSCFRPRPVPSCYRRQGEPTKEAPAARISAFFPVA